MMDGLIVIYSDQYGRPLVFKMNDDRHLYSLSVLSADAINTIGQENQFIVHQKYGSEFLLN